MFLALLVFRDYQALMVFLESLVFLVTHKQDPLDNPELMVLPEPPEQTVYPVTHKQDPLAHQAHQDLPEPPEQMVYPVMHKQDPLELPEPMVFRELLEILEPQGHREHRVTPV